MKRATSIPVGGIELAVEQTGGGEPLVLVHGSWGDRHEWAAVEEPLAQAFGVVAYDRRGHTDSQGAPTPGSRREDEDDLAALIETLELAPAHLAGNSFGASIALGLAGRRPELVRSVTAHEPPLVSLVADHPGAAQVGALAGEARSLIERGEREAAARFFVERVALGPGAWDQLPPADRATMVANAGTFADEQADPGWADADLEALAALGRPVLLTQGDQSPPFFAAIIATLASGLDGAGVRTVPGAGHIPHQTHPAEWAAMVSEFAAGAG